MEVGCHMESKKRAIKALNTWIKIQKQATFINHNKRDTSVKELLEIYKELKEKMTILICGEFNAGKSTFINALLGEKILVSDITPATAIITKLTYGKEKKVVAHFHNNKTKEYDFVSLKQLTVEDDEQSGKIRSAINFVEIQLPYELLKYCTLIDSPGLTSLYQQHTEATNHFLEQSDAAIWLFNSMNVGTASEIVWLKKLSELKIPTFGLVNGIDRLDEDEDLEAFYEYNLRRLHPLITHLDGISARDILEGKLTENNQLKEWGNLSTLEDLFSKFEEAKMNDFFQQLKEPLTKLNNSLQEQKKASLIFKKRVGLLKALKAVTQQGIEIEKAIAAEQEKKNRSIVEWQLYLQENELNPTNILSFLNKFDNQEMLIKKWEQLVVPALNQYFKRFEEINLEGRILDLKQTVTEEHFDNIETVYFKFIQTYKYIKADRDYKTHLEALQFNMEFLKEDHQKVEKALEKYKKLLQQTIIKDIEISNEKIKQLKEKWEKVLTSIKIVYGNWNFKDLLEMEITVKEIKYFQKEVLFPLIVAGNKWPSYMEVENLINNLNGLYKEVTEEELLMKMSTIASVENEENPNFSIKTITTSNNIEDYLRFTLAIPKENALIKKLQSLAPHLVKDPTVIAAGVAILMSIF